MDGYRYLCVHAPDPQLAQPHFRRSLAACCKAKRSSEYCMSWLPEQGFGVHRPMTCSARWSASLCSRLQASARGPPAGRRAGSAAGRARVRCVCAQVPVPVQSLRLGGEPNGADPLAPFARYLQAGDLGRPEPWHMRPWREAHDGGRAGPLGAVRRRGRFENKQRWTAPGTADAAA